MDHDENLSNFHLTTGHDAILKPSVFRINEYLSEQIPTPLYRIIPDRVKNLQLVDLVLIIVLVVFLCGPGITVLFPDMHDQHDQQRDGYYDVHDPVLLYAITIYSS